MTASELPEVAALPQVRRLLEIQVDMQIADLETMLVLPRYEPGLAAGMNLAATSHCFGLISGISVLFYDASIDYFGSPNGAGRRFKGVVENYMPLNGSNVSSGTAAKLLWTFARNPLAHAFGVGKSRDLMPGMPRRPGEPRGVMLGKSPLRPTLAAQVVMGADPCPLDTPVVRRGADGVVDVAVPALAWATIASLRAVLRDPAHATAAEKLAGQLLAG